MVVLKPLSDGELSQYQVIAAQQGLKYLTPDLIMLENVCPTEDMKGFFWEHMEFDRMTDKVMMA